MHLTAGDSSAVARGGTNRARGARVDSSYVGRAEHRSWDSTEKVAPTPSDWDSTAASTRAEN